MTAMSVKRRRREGRGAFLAHAQVRVTGQPSPRACRYATKRCGSAIQVTDEISKNGFAHVAARFTR